MHGVFDIRFAGVRIAFQKSGSGHDLTRVTVPTLWYVDFFPSLLYGVLTEFGKSFDCGDRLAIDLFQRQGTASHGRAVNMYGAGAALPDTAAVFRSDEIEMVSQYPQ